MTISQRLYLLILSAVLGLGLAVIWWFIARNHPLDHPWITRRTADQKNRTPATTGPALSPSIPWTALRHTPTVWWLVLSYSCLGYVAYIYISWFYLYLVNVRGFDILRGGLFASPRGVLVWHDDLADWAEEAARRTHRAAWLAGWSAGRASGSGAGTEECIEPYGRPGHCHSSPGDLQ